MNPSASLARCAAFFYENLPPSPPSSLLLLSAPAPAAAPENLWRADGQAGAVLWETPKGETWSGLGEALVVAPAGAARFAATGSALAACGDFVHLAAPGVPAFAPPFFGGFSFSPGSADDPLWAPFGDARFVLPRWIYRLHEECASLTLCLPGASGAPEREGLGHELRALWRILSAPAPEGRLPEIVDHRPAPQRTWREMVERALGEIREKRLRKVVLAAQHQVEMSDPADPVDILRRLGRERTGSFRFGFRWHGRTFAGATPELLISRRATRIFSEALAGSAPAQAADESLLADPKEREEHQAVVDHLRLRLSPLCTCLTAPATPRIRGLRHLRHLHTPFAGTLAAPLSLPELAAALHPTPAVAGAPAEAAQDWIARHEPRSRGWYAGGVGRIDLRGDGDLAVALRCLLVRGRAARLFAGAGIVEGSLPENEYAEVALKMRAGLEALGRE